MKKQIENITQQAGKLPPPERIFFYGMGLVAVGGALYFAREYFLDKKPGYLLPEGQTEKPKKDSSIIRILKSKTSSNGFPLKKGSSGDKVKQLQEGLAKIIGATAMQQNGGIDGKFGSGTENALKLAGYPAEVDEDTFNRITGNSGGSLTPTVSFNPAQLANMLYSAAQEKSLDKIVSILKQLKTSSDYSALNEQYKSVTNQHDFVHKTIVTDLLDNVFDNNPLAKDRLKAEFFRIGLKLDGSSGKWSLSGIYRHNDIITMVNTYVVNPSGDRIPVRKNVILGEALASKNGFTLFRSIDNFKYAVPTQTIKHLN